jgi:protein-disulfide isomerase
MRHDMADPRMMQLVQYDMQLGRNAGVSVTPSYIVGPRFFPGYHTDEEFKQALASSH